MLRSLAFSLSVVFHPLLIPSYMLLLLLLINPYLFGVSSPQDEPAKLLLVLVFLYTFFIPAVSFMVMYFLGMIKDIQVNDRTERIGPYLITGMLYLWVYYNFSQNGEMPTAYVSFMLGVVIALFLAFIVNIFSKISAHAVGMGGLVGMVIISMLWFSYGSFSLQFNNGQPFEVSMLHLLMLAVIAAGAVGTGRLILKAHEPSEVYGGYLVGFATQFFAFAFTF
jgi:membrane-associated phospholipid phosphatase